MSRQGKLIASVALAVGLSGCGTYSNMVNHFGPDKPVSDMRGTESAELLLATTPPPFCPAPKPAYTAEELASLRVLLYFYHDTEILTEESRKEAERFYTEVIKHYAKEVFVTGHTDTSGSDAYNMALSQRRAEVVKGELIKIGVDPAIIQTRAMGERDLLVDTPDNVRELRNRRVEITVR